MGILDLDADLSFNEKTLAQTDGKASIQVAKLRLPSQNLTNFLGMMIPPLNLGILKGKMSVRSGTLEFSNFQLGSLDADLKGTLTGNIRLGEDLSRSDLNITLRLQASDKLLKNNDAKGFLAFMDSAVGTGQPGNYALVLNGPIDQASTFFPKKAVND